MTADSRRYAAMQPHVGYRATRNCSRKICEADFALRRSCVRRPTYSYVDSHPWANGEGTVYMYSYVAFKGEVFKQAAAHYRGLLLSTIMHTICLYLVGTGWQKLSSLFVFFFFLVFVPIHRL